MTDALGHDIVLNTYYGYSRNQNGFTHIRVGKVTKLNEKSVTMDVEIHKTALYDNPLEEDKCSNKISIKSNMLFPVDMTKKCNHVPVSTDTKYTTCTKCNIKMQINR